MQDSFFHTKTGVTSIQWVYGLTAQLDLRVQLDNYYAANMLICLVCYQVSDIFFGKDGGGGRQNLLKTGLLGLSNTK